MFGRKGVKIEFGFFEKFIRLRDKGLWGLRFGVLRQRDAGCARAGDSEG